ncbi:GAP family protein [Nocardia otitidiscaviarum]|nr:GAP family protein [Nocardia otitidiscaviarum]
MLIFLLVLAGFAFLDSLDVLMVGVTTAVIYDSRLGRRSPVPGVLSFLAGVFAVTTTFGICTVLGLSFVTDLVDFTVTPTLRYWGELIAGIVLLTLGAVRISGSTTAAVPTWALEARRRPWLLGLAGIAIGLGQAPTAVPYLAALAMLSARDPRPAVWPLIIIGYCAIALLPPALVLLTATRETARARRFHRRLVRGMRRFGPASVRVLFLIFGAVLVIDALRHHTVLW